MSLKNRLDKKESTVSTSTQKMGADDPYTDLKIKIQHRVIEDLDIDFSELSEDFSKFTGDIEALIQKHVSKEALNMTNVQRDKISKELMDEILGFGPITILLDDPDVTEVMVNGPKKIFVEKSGKLQLADVQFKDNNHVLHVIKRLLLYWQTYR